MVHLFLTNNSFTMLPGISVSASQVSIKRLWIFWGWIQKDLSLSTSWPNVEALSSETILSTLWNNVLIFFVGMSIIKHSSNWIHLNWDSTKALKIVCLLLKEKDFAILETGVNFWLALLHYFKTYLLSSQSLSIALTRSLTPLFS